MENVKSQALEKIQTGLNSYKGNRYGEVLKEFVGHTLKTFSEQNEEFAQAVLDGGAFKDCMDVVCKGLGVSLSDLDVAKRAAQFYFPGADIKMEMTIYTSVFEREDTERETPAGGGIILNLEDFL